MPRPGKRSAVPADRGLAAPPWALFWVVTALIAAPGQLGAWRASLSDLFGLSTVHADVGSGSGMLRMTDVVDLAGPALLAAALATLLAAPLRGRIIRHRYGLAASDRPVIAEITAFPDRRTASGDHAARRGVLER